MTALLCLPNEILIAITANLDAVPDLAALALASRRFHSIAQSALYAAAAYNRRTARQALFYSAENGFIDSVRMLLAHGVNPNAMYFSPIPRDSLHRVLAAQGRRPGRQPLIDRKFALEYIAVNLRSDSDPRSELTISYRRLLASLSHGSVDIRGLGESASFSWLIGDLHAAVSQSDFNTMMVSLSVQATQDSSSPGLEPESDSLFHWTALHVAAQRGNDELAKLLLDGGATIDPLLHVTSQPAILGILDGIFVSRLVPTCRESPLHLAMSGGHSSTAELLLSYGASTDVAFGGAQALHLAAWHGALDICRLLVDRDASLVEERTSAGLTPFHFAAAAGNVQTVGRFLRDKAADIHASFEGRVLAGNVHPEWNCNALTHALRTRRYSDAWMLLAMDPDFAVPRENQLHPVEACFAPRDILPSDEEQMVPILQRLLLNSGQISLDLAIGILHLAAEKQLARAMNVLLKDAKYSVPKAVNLSMSLSKALEHAKSEAGVDAVMTLVDYRVSKLGMPTPGVSCVFVWGFNPNGIKYFSEPANLEFTTPGALEAKLEIARQFHKRLTASSQDVDHQDLRVALVAACQPGGLKVCEWLSSVGALRLVEKSDFVTMLERTARPTDLGGSDLGLAKWVLAQADCMGCKGWVLDHCDVPRMILRAEDCTIPGLLISQGANLNSPDGFGSPPDDRDFPYCTRRHQLGRQYLFERAENALVTVCANPEMTGAAEFLQLAVGVAGEGVGSLVNCALSFWDSNRQIFTLATLVCFAEPKGDILPSESARLTMLKLLLDAGAEVHALVDCSSQDMDAETRDEAPESLHHALTRSSKRASNPPDEASSALAHEPHGAAFLWEKDPMRNAILNRMPTLVQAMLEARPLPQKSHTAALHYLQYASGGIVMDYPFAFGRLCPRVLEVVLDMTNLEHADVAIDPQGRTALMVLFNFYSMDDYRAPVSDARRKLAPDHECRCEPDLIGFENNHLGEMVSLLLARGAKWTTRSLETGTSALDDLRVLLRSSMKFKSMYKQHNLAEFRKHIVLDIYSAASADPPLDFNPFEMGTIKATAGSR